MIVNRCFIDTETYSPVPIEHGNDLYTRAAECMIVTWALNDEPVRIWEPWQDPAIPDELAQIMADPAVYFVAHNASFDRLILLRALRLQIPIQRWWCTRAQAYAHGLPGSLEMLGVVMGLAQDQQKRVEDGKLIHTFCVPQKPSGIRIWPTDQPANWKRFCEYGIQDTATLREVYRRMPQHNYQGQHLSQWHLDQFINGRGFQFDTTFARTAIAFLERAKALSNTTMEQLSGGEVQAATQRNRLLAFIQKKFPEIQTLRAAEVREWLEYDDLDPLVRLLLEERLEAGKSSGSKYARGIRMVSPDGRQRFTQQFNGAGRTGRDSGRGFQPHNMSRPALTVRRENGRIELTPVKAKYIDDVIMPGIYNGAALSNSLVYGGPHEACALALRHSITAAPGNELVVGDWKNIESVITAWCADESNELQAFEEAFNNPKDKSKDVYRIQFSQFFGTPVAEVNDTERQSGKVSKLAFGFGGGVGALVTMAAGYQMDLDPLAEIVLPRATEEQKEKAYKAWRRAFLRGEDYDLEPRVYQACDVLKQVYRTTNNRIDQFRKDVGAAVVGAIEQPNQAVFKVGRCQIWCTGAYLIIELPSGRRLLYADPKIFVEAEPDIEGGKPWIRKVVTYVTARGKSWRRERAWDGIFVENIVQAIANDVLRATRIELHRDTLRVPEIAAYLQTLPPEERTAIVLCVHDEICLDVPRGSYPEERMRRIMCAPKCNFDTGVIWSTGLPLAADLWTNFRYGKR